jgi:hypothetical protein
MGSNSLRGLLTALIVSWLLFLLKDFYHGQGIVKRFFKVQVVDISTNKYATPLQRFIRNLTILVLPVEIVVLLINDGRRLGDIMADTVVTNYSPDRVGKPASFFARWFPAIIILTIAAAALVFSPKKSASSIKFVEASLNNDKNLKIEAEVLKSFHSYCDSVDVRMYDSVSGERSSYVSFLVFPKKMEMVDDDNFREALLDSMILYSERLDDKGNLRLEGKVLFIKTTGYRIRYLYYNID